jgi:hypothetical protein
VRGEKTTVPQRRWGDGVKCTRMHDFEHCSESPVAAATLRQVPNIGIYELRLGGPLTCALMRPSATTAGHFAAGITDLAP